MDNNDLYHVVFIGGVLLTVSIFASKLSKLVGTPLLLLFLAIGMLCGEDGVVLHIVYNDYTSAFYIANLMLALILFDGGLRTDIHELKSVAKESMLLSTFGVFITSAITGLAAYSVLDLTLTQALLIGAIVGSTDAAAVFMLLGDGGVSLKQKVSSTLKIESATNDPMAILLTTVLLALVSGKAKSGWDVVIFFFQQFGYGLILGIIFGTVARFMIAFFSLGAGLYALLAIGMGLIGYSVTSALGGSGCLAIFIIGMCIGNQKVRAVSYILPVGEGITYLAQITLFLMLGILVTPHLMAYYLAPGIVVAIVISFIARPLAVFVLIKPFFKSFKNKDLLFMSWVGLRGSVPVVLAIYPVMEDVRNAQLYFNVAFVVVLFSLLVQGASLLPASKLFKVYAPAHSAPVSKSEMGIMLSNDYEIFNYGIKDFTLDGVRLNQIRMPRRTSFAAVFRDGFMLKPSGDLRLKSDDIVSIIGADGDEPMLNSVFSQKGGLKKPREFCGEIRISAKESMKDVAKRFDMELTAFELKLNVGEFMSYHIGGFPQVGDSVSLINSSLVVSAVDSYAVTEVGVILLRSEAPAEKNQSSAS